MFSSVVSNFFKKTKKFCEKTLNGKILNRGFNLSAK